MPRAEQHTTSEWLARLSSLPGVSGHESPIAREVESAFAPRCDRVDRDRAGNVRAWIDGTGEAPRPRALLAAHMDRIGFLVKRIDPGGYLRLTELGGFDPRVLMAQEVRIHSKPPITGVFATRPPHLQKKGETERVLPVEELYVDTGRPEREVRRRVPIGTSVTLRRDAIELLGGKISGPAMDDRAGVTVLLKTLELLRDARPEWDVVAVATVEEEFGVVCLGAKTASEGIGPDLGIAIDVSHGDMPGAREGEIVPLGGGPSLCVGGNIHPRVFEGLRDSAVALAIPYQVEGCPTGSGTDAMDIQIARGGIPTAVLGIPCRYMHTSVETVEPRDVERCAGLLAHYVRGLPAEWRAVEVLK